MRSIYMPLLQLIHKFGSPPWFYSLTRWLVPCAVALGLALLLAAWFWGVLIAPEDARQGNSYRIIYVHVPSAVLALAGYYIMALSGVVFIVWRIGMMRYFISAAAGLGALLTFMALFSGAVWAKPTWNTWWQWDARITSMLVLFFLYLGVLALIEAFEHSEVGYKAAALLSLVGTVNIPIIYKSVDWWNSLHQPATLKLTTQSSMHASMLYPLLLSIVAFYVLYFGLLLWRVRIQVIDHERDKNWLQKRLCK